MKPTLVRMIGLSVLVWAVSVSPVWRAQAQKAETPDARMAPLDQYLMDRDAEIALAKSAAPKAISDEAEVLVFERQGYKTAVKGTNGFVCIVERSWTDRIDEPEFWNPKTSRSAMPQRSGSADVSSTDDRQNKAGVGGKIEGTDVRRH